MMKPKRQLGRTEHLNCLAKLQLHYCSSGKKKTSSEARSTGSGYGDESLRIGEFSCSDVTVVVRREGASELT
jgi:hypothetical protein